MKRVNIPLWVGIAGLLALQANCADSPTDPAWIGAPEALAQPEYLDVLVRNDARGRVGVSAEFDGVHMEALGILREGTSGLFRVTSPALAGGGPVRFVAVVDTESGRLASEPLEVMARWAVEVAITSTNAVASRSHDLESRARE